MKLGLITQSLLNDVFYTQIDARQILHVYPKTSELQSNDFFNNFGSEMQIRDWSVV